MDADAVYQDVTNRFLIPAFREISITHCVPIGSFYSTVHQYTYVEQIAKKTYDRTDFAQRSYRHLRNIIERIALVGTGKDCDPDLDVLVRPTIFDTTVSRLMISEYNHMAQQLDMVPAPKGYATILMERRSDLGPDGVPIRRYAFVELVAIAILNCALNRSSVEVLNRPIETDNQRKRARGRFRKMKDVWGSPLFRKAVAMTFFELFCDVHRDRMIQTLEELSKIDAESDKEYKRIFYKAKELAVSKENFFRQCELQEHLYVSDWFFDFVFPVAGEAVIKQCSVEKIIDKMLTEEYGSGESEEKRDAVSQEEYTVIGKVADLFNGYLDMIFEDTITLLECLPEAEGLSKKPFREYFEII